MENTFKQAALRVQQETPIADWFVALGNDSPYERWEASAAAPPPLTAVPSLLSLLKDSASDVRIQAATALGDVVGAARRALPAIRAALKEAALNDADDRVRDEAVRALLTGGPEPETAVAGLIDALHSEIDLVRFHAAVILGGSGPAGEPAVPALIHASLWDVEEAVRVAAAMALWKLDANSALALDVLVKALEDKNELLCWIAAEYLGQIGPEAAEAVPALRRVLNREFKIPLIKAAVMLALERIERQSTAQPATVPINEQLLRS
jgi:HEAT repeat protein